MLRPLLLLALFVPLAAVGCGTPRPVTAENSPVRDTMETPPTLDAPFALARGATATVDGLGVTFSAVLEDSRCPVNVTCVWEGRATVNLALTEGGRSGGVNLELPGGTGADDINRHRTIEALGHRITLMALDPYPGTDGAENGAPPVATLKVERS